MTKEEEKHLRNLAFDSLDARLIEGGDYLSGFRSALARYPAAAELAAALNEETSYMAEHPLEAVGFFIAGHTLSPGLKAVRKRVLLARRKAKSMAIRILKEHDSSTAFCQPSGPRYDLAKSLVSVAKEIDNVTGVALFGSVAHGCDTEDSDVDLYIKVEEVPASQPDQVELVVSILGQMPGVPFDPAGAGREGRSYYKLVDDIKVHFTIGDGGMMEDGNHSERIWLW